LSQLGQSGHFGRRPALLIYPDQQTFLVFVGVSRRCQ
jgi:hypothetical protein